MQFDFSKVLENAKNAIETTDSEKVSYPYPLVYPAPGQTLIVKILYNPASGQITRLVNRHDKIACLRTYGQECPICKKMQEVMDVLGPGQDPFGKKKSKARGISYATLISATKPIKSGEKILNPGDTVMLMYPWSVYKQISQALTAITTTPSALERAFENPNEGLFIQISVSDDNKYQYTTTVMPYMTFATGMTDEGYRTWLSSMPSLNEQVLPSTITEAVSKAVQEYVTEIHNTYIAPRIPNLNVTQNNIPTNIGNINPNVGNPNIAQMPQTPVVNNVPNIPFNTGTPIPNMGNTVNTGSPLPNMGNTIAQQNVQNAQMQNLNNIIAAQQNQLNNNKPSCYKQYQENAPKCMCCPYEVQCSADTFAESDEIPF